MAERLNKPAWKTAVKVTLTVWLIVKLLAAVLSLLMGVAGLTAFAPSVEVAFQSLMFMKSWSAGLAVFICFVVVLSLGCPASFLILPENRVQNIIGFIAYAVVTLTDIVSIFIMGFGDILAVIALILNLLMSACLILYGRQNLPGANRADGEEEENNS